MEETVSSSKHFTARAPTNAGTTNVSAVEHLRKMRGGSQSHLMRCSDGKLYVVKFINNPQHMRVLANETLAHGLATLVGLPVPQMALVWVDEFFIQHTPALTLIMGGEVVPCQSGLQFGSEFVINPLEGRIFDCFPMEQLDRVRNLIDFVGMLAFDKWTGNVDNRQATFWRTNQQRKYTATFIDQGHCFNLGEWTFPDKLFGGIYQRTEVYKGVQGWRSFEPWLSRIETMHDSSIWTLGNCIPPDWLIGRNDLSHLLKALVNRRSIVRRLIHNFRISNCMPFPNWNDKPDE